MQTRSSPSRNTLHRLAEQVSIPNYKKMSKKLLYESLKEQYDLNRLQRIDKRRRNKKISKRLYHDDLDDEEIELNEVNLSSSSSSTTTSTRRRAAAPTTVVSSSETKTKLRKKIRLSCQSKCDNDDIDPIMRIPLGKHIFTFIRPNGSSTRFNVESLIDYMLETGDFTDPSSRLSFSDDDLKMIDKISSDAKLNKESVYHAKKNNSQLYAEKHFKRDALQGLERCAGEIISEMLQLIEDSDPEEAQMKLLMADFPAFADLYQQIKDADPAFAKQCKKSWLQYLQGPPNHPTRDPSGLLQIILQFVKACDNHEANNDYDENIEDYSNSTE